MRRNVDRWNECDGILGMLRLSKSEEIGGLFDRKFCLELVFFG